MRPATLLCFVFAGCAAEPQLTRGGAGTQAEEAVEMLGGGFVRVDGERIPLEELLYRMRQEARAADASEGPRPAVRLLDSNPEGVSDGERRRMVARIIDDLRHFSVAVRLGDG